MERAIRATVVADYAGAQGVRIPAGSLVSGRTEGNDRARLRLAFQTLRIDGVDYPIRARVSDVDNAREKVAPDGTILALDPLRKRPGRVELILLAAAHAHPATLALVEGTKLTLREIKKPSVHYPAGTDLALLLDLLPPVKPQPNASVPEGTPAAPAELAAILRTLPQRTATYQDQKPSDWVNLAFAGSREALVAAFDSAGWVQAAQLSLQADFKVFLALAAHHSYRNAPVSRLAIAGQLPDLVYQKQTNTFAKRHHIRIWMAGRQWNGAPLWLAAATHDIGIDFAPASKTFTHRIDSNVDAEREKVTSDLSFAGAVRNSYVVSRADLPAESRNATGDLVRTDGNLRVIVL